MADQTIGGITGGQVASLLDADLIEVEQGGVSKFASMAQVRTLVTPTVNPPIVTTLVGAQTLAINSAIYNLIFCDNATLLTVNGFGGALPSDGWVVDVVSRNAQVDFVHRQLAAPPFQLLNRATFGLTSLAAGLGFARYMYDSVGAGCWRLLVHEQGDWINVAFNAADFTGNGSMVWAVDPGDVSLNKYWLKEKSLHWAWVIQTSSVSGTPSANLLMKLPVGLNAAAIGQYNGVHTYKDGASPWKPGAWWVNPALLAQINLYIDGFGTAPWTATVNATATYGWAQIGVK